ncbi:MAG: adenylosuccinate lyase [Acidimicrobiia bacterium]
MISRYSLPEMAAVWSSERKLSLWRQIESLAAEAWEALGRAPAGTGAAIASAAPITPEELAKREMTTQHDLAAFVDLLAERSGPAAEWVHYGLTSSDVLDTATAVQLTESTDLLLARTAELFQLVKDRALENQDSVMVGRTHGIWAEPTTFGLKLAGWAFELARDHQRLQRTRATVAVGKVSGAVGTYSQAPPQVEELVCERLGLSIEPAPTQVTARDRHAEYLQTLAICGASIERFATEIRHLARSEVAEVAEAFSTGQKGSSAMPHKRNPVTSERTTGLARLLRGYAGVGLENMALWHERDISHSSAERVVLPDASLVLHYILVKFRDVVADLVIDASRMRQNLEATSGLVYSQTVLYALIDSGLSREAAYRTVQEKAATVIDEGISLRDALVTDPATPLSDDQLDRLFSWEPLLDNSAVIWKRLEELELS